MSGWLFRHAPFPLRAEAGSRPGGRPSFLARARKEGKRSTPLLAATPSLRCGATCVGASAGCAVKLTARLWRCAQTATASQSTKHARAGAHATPQTPRRRRLQKGGEPTRAIAALGPERRQRFAPRSARPSAAMARIALPFWTCREAQGAGWRVCRRTHPLRELTCRVCPNGAPQARSELRGTPRERASQVTPTRSVGVTDSRVALSLVTFFRRAKESYCAAGRTSRPPPCEEPAGWWNMKPAPGNWSLTPISYPNFLPKTAPGA